MFSIKPGYLENPGPVFFLDDVTADRGIVFQPDVYNLAEFLADLIGIERMVDVGCGWADKLAGIHDRRPRWELTGIDFDVNIAHCRDTHPWGTWIDHDLERPLNGIDASDAIVICSDVIEHVVDPRVLLASLRTMAPRLVVLSTPERDVQHGYTHNGPSVNPCHVREWNVAELRDFLTTEGFTVHFAGLTRGSDINWTMPTQVLLVSP